MLNFEIIFFAFCAWVVSVFAVKTYFDYEEILEEINGNEK